jgi:hypothetical protein
VPQSNSHWHSQQYMSDWWQLMKMEVTTTNDDEHH